jgi:hypothetical protein
MIQEVLVPNVLCFAYTTITYILQYLNSHIDIRRIIQYRMAQATTSQKSLIASQHRTYDAL